MTTKEHEAALVRRAPGKLVDVLLFVSFPRRNLSKIGLTAQGNDKVTETAQTKPKTKPTDLMCYMTLWFGISYSVKASQPWIEIIGFGTPSS